MTKEAVREAAEGAPASPMTASMKLEQELAKKDTAMLDLQRRVEGESAGIRVRVGGASEASGMQGSSDQSSSEVVVFVRVVAKVYFDSFPCSLDSADTGELCKNAGVSCFLDRNLSLCRCWGVYAVVEKHVTHEERLGASARKPLRDLSWLGSETTHVLLACRPSVKETRTDKA